LIIYVIFVPVTMIRRTRIHREIFAFLCLVLAFFIPFTIRILPAVIFLMGLNWLLEPGYANRFRAAVTGPCRLLTLVFTLLYFLYLAGMLYSENQEFGRFDLEIKLSFLVFPLIFATSGVSRADRELMNRILMMFVAGAVTGALVFLTHSAYLSYATTDPDPFYYVHLSWYMHTSYLSMYACFALAIIAWQAVSRFTETPAALKIGMGLSAVILLVFIILLSARAGILMVVLLAVVVSVFLIFKQKRTWTGIGLLAGFALVMIAFSILFPFAFGRLQATREAVEVPQQGPGTEKSQDASFRLAIWKSSFELVKAHPFIGVGTGDVKDEMVKNYMKNGIDEAYRKKFNSHNQYLQTAVALGIPGLIVLALMLALPAVFALRRGYYLYFAFLLIVGFNLLFESMFEGQAGTIFYGFFNTLFFWNMANREEQ